MRRFGYDFVKSALHNAPKWSVGTMFLSLLIVTSCARMGQPDGGWYDETPPKVVYSNPKDGGANVKSRKVRIMFDEYVSIDNPTENVIVSPPQLEQPEIKSSGKSIVVELKDSLMKNTTYTIDFSDAISDFTEGNPLGNYTYSFSTGESVDTMEVSGYVVDAETLEPIKGILVGLYSNLSDTAFTTKPMLRVSRTDSRGHYIVRGVAPGTYRAYALQDADGNYIYNQMSEKLAFSPDNIIPSSKPDTRMDTLWKDSLHIASITPIPYTHFLPDNVVLRAFTPVLTNRYFIKSERTQPENFRLYFSYCDSLPQLRGLNFNADKAFIIETTARIDTVTYWLRDTSLVNKDSLEAVVKYYITDSLGVLKQQTDTMQFLSKVTYAKRLRDMKKTFDSWQKKQDKLKKKGEHYDSIMAPKPLDMKVDLQSELDPDRNIPFTFASPMAKIDTSKIHLYARHDSVWYKSRYKLVDMEDTSVVRRFPNLIPSHRFMELRGEWRPDIEYSLEIDSAALVDIYGYANVPIKKGFKVHPLDDYGTLMLTIDGFSGKSLIVELLDTRGNPVKRTYTKNGTAEFFYLKEDDYYLRMIVDANDNGKWDTGDYYKKLQPEWVYYYPDKIKVKAKWDVTQSWNPTAKPLNEQKPGDIVQQKSEKQKVVRHRNAQRAAKKGIQYIPKQM